jgi:hypothetical protein
MGERFTTPWCVPGGTIPGSSVAALSVDGWIHFTIRAKRAVTPEEAAGFPRLPDNWHAGATIL